MPTYTLNEPQESAEFTVLQDEDVFHANLVSLTTKVKKSYTSNEEYTRLNWKFRIDEPDQDVDGRVIYGETSEAFVAHPECKFYSWAQAVMGVEFPPGFNINTDDLIDMQCRIVVGAREYEKDGETRVYNFVKDVMPSRRGGSLTSDAF